MKMRRKERKPGFLNVVLLFEKWLLTAIKLGTMQLRNLSFFRSV